MTIIVPNVGEVAIAKRILNQELSLKLYSNDIIPDELDTLNTYIEVVGGGYSSKTLVYTNWIINSDGTCYYPFQDFRFTSAPSGSGTVYGYYIHDGNNVLMWSERFPTSVLPFSPINDTLIRVTPRIQVA